jgi:hypothetical protein
MPQYEYPYKQTTNVPPTCHILSSNSNDGLGPMKANVRYDTGSDYLTCFIPFMQVVEHRSLQRKVQQASSPFRTSDDDQPEISAFNKLKAMTNQSQQICWTTTTPTDMPQPCNVIINHEPSVIEQHNNMSYNTNEERGKKAKEA